MEGALFSFSTRVKVRCPIPSLVYTPWNYVKEILFYINFLTQCANGEFDVWCIIDGKREFPLFINCLGFYAVSAVFLLCDSGSFIHNLTQKKNKISSFDSITTCLNSLQYCSQLIFTYDVIHLAVDQSVWWFKVARGFTACLKKYPENLTASRKIYWCQKFVS